MSTARGQCAFGQEVGTGTGRSAPDITTSTPALSPYTPRPPLSPPDGLVVWRVALARTHTRVALCPVSRTQLGWVSAFNPLGGARSLSRKACIHLRPRKAVGFVSGCVTDCGPRGQTDGLDWQQLTTTNLLLPCTALPHPVCSPLSSTTVSWTWPTLFYIGSKTNISPRELCPPFSFSLRTCMISVSLSLSLSIRTSLRSIDVTFSRYDLEMCVHRSRVELRG